MPNNQKGNNSRDHSSAPARSMKSAILLTAVSTIIVLLLLFFFFRPELQSIRKVEAAPTENSSEQKTNTIIEAPDLRYLLGRWERTDGDYILEVLSASPDGNVEVSYFNPKPIHVDRAEWAVDKGKLYVMIESQDVNYPGSTYGLQYDADQDKLTGMYFQTVDESTYDVAFVREKK